MQNVIIDTDIGDDIDDAYALAYALAEPGLNVLGVTTAFRNTRLRSQLVLQLLRAYGRLDVPVAEGIRQPLNTPADVEDIPAHWDEGVNPVEPNCSMDAVRFIIETARRHPDTAILAIAPLTNIACAVRIAPDVMRGVPLYVMCGMYSAHYPEWNVCCDPEAADIVFKSYERVTMVGLDVTLKCRMTPEEVEAMQAVDDERVRLLSRWTRKWMERSHHMPILHDPLTAAAIAHPELIEFEPMQLRVERSGEFSRGVTARRVDAFWGSEPPANAAVAAKVDCERFKDLFFARVFPQLKA